MIALLSLIPASVRLAGLAAVAIAALAGLWRLHASIDAAGYARAQAEFAVAQEAARAEQAAENVERARAFAAIAAREAALREENRRLEDDLSAIEGRADVAFDPRDLAGVRDILATATRRDDPQAIAPAR